MREKQFSIKYRYARHEEETSLQQEDQFYQWYLINISELINEGEITTLTFDILLELLRNDNASFYENNIKMKQNVYWITIGSNNFEIDFTIEEDEEDMDSLNEIVLLLERQKDQQSMQENETMQNLTKNMDKLYVIVDRMASKQNEFIRFFQVENEIIFKDVLEDTLNMQLERQKELFNVYINTTQNALHDYYTSLVGQIQQVESKQNQALNFQNNYVMKTQNHLNTSSQFMEQSFQYKPNQTFQTFMHGTRSESKQFNNSLNNQQSMDFEIKKQDTKESINIHDLAKQQSQVMKLLEQSEFDCSLTNQNKNSNNTGANLKDEDFRMKAGSAISDGTISTIQHMDSKRTNVFNQNGLQSKSDSLKNQENSSLNQGIQSSVPDIEGKEEQPMFNFKISDKEESKPDAGTQKGFIMFNIPQDDDSTGPDIDFFKNVKPKVNEKPAISHPHSSEQSNRQIIEESASFNSNNNLNNTHVASNQNNVSVQNTAVQNTAAQTKFPSNHNLLTVPNTTKKRDSSNNSTQLIKLTNITTVTNSDTSKDNKLIDTQQRTKIGRDVQRRNSKQYKNLNDSRVLSNQNSGGNTLIVPKGKTANITDMTIMYSEPIVKQIGVSQHGAQPQVLPAGDPVDYELEIQKLNEFLKETNKQIKLDIVVASLDNLEKSFTRNTQILHIMCHGDYSEKEQQYYLAFEDEESKLDAITSKRFQEFLKQKNCNVKLVFFNACHSEEVGKIFQEAGIPFVIAVQSDLKIEDRAALTFSSSFYMNIFSGRSVLESFESAKISLQAKQHESCFTCCCAHSHDLNCLWVEEAMNNGFDQAHEQHKPDSHCTCKNAKRMLHELNCVWANQFLKKYKENYEDYIDEVVSNQEDQLLFTCCCHGPETPHDESLKFRLIKKPEQEDCKIMSDLPEGNIIEKSNLDFNHPIFQDQNKIFGRNMEIFKIYKHFMNNNKLKSRFVAINGELGAGKTAIAKKVARHLKERGQVVDIIFEDFERMKTKITKFEQKMRLGLHTKEVAYSHLKDRKTLFILDNCDDLIKNNKSKFENTLNELAQNTTAKFLIISHDKYDLKLGSGTAPSLTLGALGEHYVKQLIEFYAGDTIREYSNNPQFSEQLQELIKIMPKSPKSIMETVQNISENMDISQILTSLKSNQINDRQRDYTAFNLLMKELKTQNQAAYDMLLLISLFPHGVSVEDLKFLEKKKKIPHEWIKLMESLTMYSNEVSVNRTADQSLHDLPEMGIKRMQSKRITIFQSIKNEEDNMEEDDFDNDQQHEESYRFKKFKNGQYFWMSVSRKFDVVVFKIKKFVVEQLKQQEYKEDMFQKEILILEYLSIFSRKLLHNLKEKSHHQERIMEYCSLSHSGIFGVHYTPNQSLPSRTSHQQSSKSARLADSAESDYEHGDVTPDIMNGNRGFSEDQKLSMKHRDSIHLEKKVSDSTEQKAFKSLTPYEIFKLHEGNFYSYLNVDDHRQIIAHIYSRQCEERRKQKIKRHIQDLCVNIPSIHKLLDEHSTSEEQCVQAELVIDELLKNNQNSQFLIAKAKLLFLKISLVIDKFTSENLNISIEEMIHRDEIEGIYEEVDKKFIDFDKNEIFVELIDIEKQFIIFFLIYTSFKRCRENELSHTFEQILKVSKDIRFSGVKGKVNLLLESLIPKLLARIKELKRKEDSLEESQKDIKMGPNNLSVLESKIILLNSWIEIEFNTQFQLRFTELEEAIRVFESNGLNSLMISTTVAYCKQKLNGLKNSRDTQGLIKLKKDMIDPALNNSKMWKLTSLEADCKKILGEINDQLHHISSNVFQFMKSQPIIFHDKKTPYGHIIRLNQSFKRRVSEILSKSGKELNLKFEIQTIKHFRECLQRGSKFMCISCDDVEDDGIIVEEDQLPLMRKYKESEMEEYYKQHYEEFGQIEILMLCAPNGLKLKEMFGRIIDKVNDSIRKMQGNPDKSKKAKSTEEYKDQIDRDSELRRRPTIIAFQFKPNKIFKKRNNERRKTITPHHQESGEQSNSSKRNKRQGGNYNRGRDQDFSEEAEQDEYEDFYLYYLKEFATQQFQFEFLTQLLSDKPDSNPQAHIKRAFNSAKQKMVEATITLCSEDIRDEQTFEEILGKGPDLFLSDDWMDAKGQIIDITSERPPQNLNRNFLRISGRKQDIYIILQKIQENCVNIFGQVGVGKTIVAQQIAYFTFTRNIFCDGVYYFSLKQLPNFNYDLRNLMSSLLGQQFNQDVSEYFQNQRKMLLIFDDFDIIANSFTSNEYKVKFFEYLFSYVDKFDIHYILVTQKSLRPVLEQKNCPLKYIKSNMHFHEVKQFSKKEALNFLDSLLDLEQINIKRVLDTRKNFEVIYKKAQGNPKKLIEQYCKKFGNPKIPKQFLQSLLPAQQLIIQPQPTIVNHTYPPIQQIPSMTMNHNPYQPRKKTNVVNQKSREFSNQSAPQVPQLNIMQLNTPNPNYNTSFIPHSNPNSARANYKSNFANTDQNNLYNSPYQMESSLPNSIIYQPQYGMIPPMSAKNQYHPPYYGYNMMNHSQSQSLVLGNNMETSSSSLVFNPSQPQGGGSYTDRKQNTSHTLKQQQNLLKITQSGINAKSTDHLKHKSSKNLQSEHHSTHVPSPYQHSNNSLLGSHVPHNPISKHLSNYALSTSQMQQYQPHVSTLSLGHDTAHSNSTGNTPLPQGGINLSYPIPGVPQQIPPSMHHSQHSHHSSHQYQSKKSLPLTSNPQSQASKHDSQKSKSKDARMHHTQSSRNKVESEKIANIVVQSDPEVQRQAPYQPQNEQISSFMMPNSSNNYQIVDNAQNYNQFEQENLYQNQEVNVDQIELTQEDDDKIHKRAPSGNNVSGKSQIQAMGIFHSGSLVSLTQDNHHNSLSNLNNSAHLGSANNNGSQSSRKLKKSQTKSTKYHHKHIQEEMSLNQSLLDDDDMSNDVYSSNSKAMERLNSEDFMKELFGGSKPENNGESLSNSQSLIQNNSKNPSSGSNLKQPFYINDQNFSSNNDVPFNYQVNNIDEEDESKSEDEFINQLENQRNQEKFQIDQQRNELETGATIKEETREYVQQSSFIIQSIQSELKQRQRDQSFEISKGGNFANIQDMMLSSTLTEKLKQEDNLSFQENKSSKRSSINHEYIEEDYLPEEHESSSSKESANIHKNRPGHPPHHSNNSLNHHKSHLHAHAHKHHHHKSYTHQDKVEGSDVESEEDGYEEEDEEGELNEDDDIDEKKSKEQFTQNIFFDKNELRIKDDDIEDMPNLKVSTHPREHHRTPDKAMYNPFGQLIHTTSLNSPPILAISPSQNPAPLLFPQHQSLYMQHYQPQYIMPGQPILDPQMPAHVFKPLNSHHHHPLHQMSSQNQFFPQTIHASGMLKSVKPQIKETHSERQNSDGLNNSFISASSFIQKSSNQETGEKQYNRSQSNTSLPTFLPMQKSDSTTSKATIQSAGSQLEKQNLKMISHSNSLQNELQNKKNSKKKVNQTGKQAQNFKKKKNNKYNNFKNNNSKQQKSESEEEDSEDE